MPQVGVLADLCRLEAQVSEYRDLWHRNRKRTCSPLFPSFHRREQAEQLIAAALIDTHRNRSRALDRLLDAITAKTAPVV